MYLHYMSYINLNVLAFIHCYFSPVEVARIIQMGRWPTACRVCQLSMQLDVSNQWKFYHIAFQLDSKDLLLLRQVLSLKLRVVIH